MEGRGSPTPLNHYRWLCRRGRALRNTPTDGSRAWVHRGRVRVHAHTRTLPTRACPCVSLPSSGLAAECPESVLLGQGCPGSRSLRFPTRAGEGGAKGEHCCPPTPAGAVLPRSGTLMGAATTEPCFLLTFPLLPHTHTPPPPPPPPWCFWASRAHPPAERILWQEGEGSGPPLGDLPLERTLAKLP